MNLKNVSICTAAAAIMLGMAPGHLAHAASHCKGLQEAICGSTVACRWQPERKVGDKTKAGHPAKTGQSAHCRLDLKAAALLAAKIAVEQQQPTTQPK